MPASAHSTAYRGLSSTSTEAPTSLRAPASQQDKEAEPRHPSKEDAATLQHARSLRSTLGTERACRYLTLPWTGPPAPSGCQSAPPQTRPESAAQSTPAWVPGCSAAARSPPPGRTLPPGAAGCEARLRTSSAGSGLRSGGQTQPVRSCRAAAAQRTRDGQDAYSKVVRLEELVHDAVGLVL